MSMPKIGKLPRLTEENRVLHGHDHRRLQERDHRLQERGRLLFQKAGTPDERPQIDNLLRLRQENIPHQKDDQMEDGNHPRRGLLVQDIHLRGLLVRDIHLRDQPLLRNSEVLLHLTTSDILEKTIESFSPHALIVDKCSRLAHHFDCGNIECI